MRSLGECRQRGKEKLFLEAGPWDTESGGVRVVLAEVVRQLSDGEGLLKHAKQCGLYGPSYKIQNPYWSSVRVDDVDPSVSLGASQGVIWARHPPLAVSISA